MDKESQKGVGQRHKSRAGHRTTDLTSNSRTDSADNGRPGISRTDRELGFLDSTLDNISDNISDFTNTTVESTGCTDCAKPTDVQKRSMSDCKDLQYTTSLQLSPLLATQPTSDSQETP